jgi:hypothetical protein
MRQVGLNACVILLIALAASSIHSQTAAPGSDPLTKTGQVAIDGRMTPYVIHYLPPNSFPNLPEPVVRSLNQLGCLIPQTYEAHRPENVIHGAFERAGSSDWALLCSAQGTVKLLVFFASALDRPMTLFAMPETERLQTHGGSQILGFDWGIDPASPERVHDAQTGMEHRPPPPDHAAIANSVIDQRTAYYLYGKAGKWTKVDLPEP